MNTDASHSDAPALISRTVDLGREEELISWQEWFARTMAQMKGVTPDEHHERLAFRVTLADGRQFAVRQVTTHVVKGQCSMEKTRWSDHLAVCNVITGYMLFGMDDDALATTVAVPPAEIASVECVLVPTDEEEAEEESEAKQHSNGHVPFGFYSRKALKVPAKTREVEEQLKAAEQQSSK